VERELFWCLFQFNRMVLEHRKLEGTILVHTLLFDMMFEPWLATQLKMGEECAKPTTYYSVVKRKNSERFEEYQKDETVLIVSSTRT
jgi:hypothetical protein